MNNHYDLIVLGGGPGGYTAALEGAKRGLRVALVEKNKLGGTCLHQGCIPTKSYLQSASVYATLKQAPAFGITGSEVGTVELSQVQGRTNQIIAELEKGIQSLIAQQKITYYHGEGTLLGTSIFMPRAGSVSVNFNDGREPEILQSKNLILATGSRVKSLPGLELDEKQILSSDGILKLTKLPSSILIIGGGVIGLEWASLLNDFGVSVTLIENQNQILGEEDQDLAHALNKSLKKKGIRILTEAHVLPETLVKTTNSVSLNLSLNGDIQTVSQECVLVAVGRQANYDKIGLSNTKIELHNERIKVNANYQTKESHIYAIGDLINTPQLAHVAMAEGQAAVAGICGGVKTNSLNLGVPRCIYTAPEIAVVGLNEKQAEAAGLKIKKIKRSLQTNSKALIKGETDGFVKLLVDSETNDLIGASIIGPEATELISETSLALYLNSTPEELGMTIHPHPSLAETIAEAASQFN